MRRVDGSTVAWSCLVDDTPEIYASIVPWLATAIDLARIEPSQIHVHHVDALRPELAALCHRLAIVTHQTEAFDRRFPHTNKIRQCATDFGQARHVVLTDVDIAFAAAPPLEGISSPVSAKLVDLPNPPVEILRRIVSASGLTPPRTCTNTYLDSSSAQVVFETLCGNCNGGLLVLGRQHVASIGRAWTWWARWLIDRIDLLDRWAVHVDQVSFCLAIRGLGLEVDLLTDEWNFPLRVRVAANGIEPLLLHHHAVFDENVLARGVSPGSRNATRRVNKAIKSFERRHLPAGSDLTRRSPAGTRDWRRSFRRMYSACRRRVVPAFSTASRPREQDTAPGHR